MFRVFGNLFHATENSAPDAMLAHQVHDWTQAQFASYVDQYCAE